MRAKRILEEVYEVVISSKAPYHLQFERLNTSGELSNMNSLIKVLLRLCEAVDEQEKEINALKSMLDVQNTNPTGPDTNQSL